MTDNDIAQAKSLKKRAQVAERISGGEPRDIEEELGTVEEELEAMLEEELDVVGLVAPPVTPPVVNDSEPTA